MQHVHQICTQVPNLNVLSLRSVLPDPAVQQNIDLAPLGAIYLIEVINCFANSHDLDRRGQTRQNSLELRRIWPPQYQKLRPLHRSDS